jgi:hypothetical protein
VNTDYESAAPRGQFPTPPLKGRHLFAVCRFDEMHLEGDPTSAFILTRGYWDEALAQAQAAKLNASMSDQSSRYYVLPVRVTDE